MSDVYQVTVIQTDHGVYIDNDGELVEVPCQWFALCDNHAATTEPHPVLGDVPICNRCAEKVEATR